MIEGYTKLFSTIVSSSLWAEDSDTKVLWITLLALSDANGEIGGSIPGLAQIAGIPVDSARTAITRFLAPDPDSRTKDNDGRRIEEVDGGWRLLNYKVYREKLSQADQKEQARVRKQRQRERDKRDTSVTERDMSRMSRHTDTDTDTDTKTSTTKSSTDAEASDDGRAGNRFFTVTREEWDEYAKEIRLEDPGAPWDHYVSNGWKISGRAPMKDWKAALRNWKRNESKFSRKPFKPESRESQEQVFVKSFKP